MGTPKRDARAVQVLAGIVSGARTAGGSVAPTEGPLYRRLYRDIAAAVLDGRLAPGTRLPSTRSLATQLGVARGTVETSYQMLVAEGYLTTLGAAGTIVSRQLGLNEVRLRRPIGGSAPDDSPVPSAEPDRSARVSTPEPSSRVAPLMLGVPAWDAFPHKLWARLVARQARASGVERQGADTFGYQPPNGAAALRAELVAYLAVARGIHCSPEQILVTNGFQGALSLIARAVLAPGDPVRVEDPGYSRGREALSLAGLKVVGTPVDADGLVVDDLPRGRRAAKAVLVTPTHHFPLGQSLSLSRRTALLEWADRKSAWVVEDDYDSEFRYAGPPLPSLKSLDTVERVLYLGTFSKVLSPSLGVGYLVVPRQLVERLSAVARLLQPPPAPLIQNAIASFMREGHFGRHIGRMRRLYGERRDALHAALRRASPSLVTIRGPGGMHLLCLLPAGTDDMAVAISVRERGLYPAPLSWYHVESPQPPGLLLGFTNVEVDQADAVARRFVDTLRKQGIHV